MHKLLALVSLAVVAGCAQDHSITGIAADRSGATLATAPLSTDGPGVVYALTNQSDANAVAMFARAASGELTWLGNVPTGGSGAGAALGSQGALVLSDDGRWLFAVNAGSNDVSAFRVTASGPSLTSRIAAGGTRPISATVHGDVLYVLDAGGAGNISGFRIDNAGTLTPITGSTQPLSGNAVGPAQISFTPDGRWLIVSEKTTNRLDVYVVEADGSASTPSAMTSAGGTPFGFAFGHRGELFVSEAAGSASSYVTGRDGTLALASGAVQTHQGAPCWAVVTGNGQFGYTANAQGGSISGFSIAPDGAIALIEADGRTAVVGPGNIDLAISNNSRFLYQLNGNRSISGFRIEADGHLTPVGNVAGLPGSAVGLVAR